MSTVTPGQVASQGSIGYNYGPDAIFPPIYLTGATLTAKAAAFPTLTFAGYNSLEIRLHIAGYSAGDIGSLQFNGDTGANYWDRNVTSVAGGVVLVNTQTLSTTQMRFGISGTGQVIAIYNIINVLAVSKLCAGKGAMGTGAAGTGGTAIVSMAGEWVNTTAQITSVKALVVGANNFLSGSTIQVFGGL
jgi:hypothetical protein